MTSWETFQSQFAVSRETIERLELFEALLKRWNDTINLIGRSTADDIWTRHFADSAAALKIAEQQGGKWVDMGSGAGLPALVHAILRFEKDQTSRQVCIEADLRKSEFIRTVSRQTKVPCDVITRRIEDTPSQNANVLTARALAPVNRLLDYAEKHLAPDGICVFHKGERWVEEVDEAQKRWSFKIETHPNPSSDGSVLLEIGEIQRV